MKTLFYGYGYRDTKSWSCFVCNYHVSGMDLMVDTHRRTHELTCTPFLKPVKPLLDTDSFHIGFAVAKSNLESLARAALKQGWTSADSLVKLMFGEEKA